MRQIQKELGIEKELFIEDAVLSQNLESQPHVA